MRKLFIQVKSTVTQNWPTTLALLVCVAIVAALQYASRNVFVDPDAFYHGKVSTFFPSIHSFPWLAYTTLSEHFADQHYLFHILLKPFGSIHGLHLATVIFAAFNLVAFAHVLKFFKVSAKPLWLILYLCGSATFLLRFNLVKAVPLFCALLFLVVPYIVRKRSWALLVGAWLSVWTYGGFILLPLLTFLHAFTTFVCTKKIVYKPFLFVCIGIGFGIFSHPYHATLPQFLWEQIVESGLTTHAAVTQGYEWLPYNIASDSLSDILVLAPWVAGLYIVIKKILHERSEENVLPICLGVVSTALFALTLQSGRHVEYWIPFAILFCAVIYTPYLKKYSLQNMLREFLTRSVLFRSIGAAFCLCAVLLVTKNIVQTYATLKDGTDAHAFKPAATWLKEHSLAQSIVWNTQWDEFPQLFYWNQHNYYIVGLDPTFMYLQNPEQYLFYKAMANESTLSASAIHERLTDTFHAQYIFLENKRNPQLKKTLDTSPAYFSLEFRDNTSSVYMIH